MNDNNNDCNYPWYYALVREFPNSTNVESVIIVNNIDEHRKLGNIVFGTNSVISAQNMNRSDENKINYYYRLVHINFLNVEQLFNKLYNKGKFTKDDNATNHETLSDKH